MRIAGQRKISCYATFVYIVMGISVSAFNAPSILLNLPKSNARGACRSNPLMISSIGKEQSVEIDIDSSIALCNIRFALQNEKDPWIRSLSSTSLHRFIRARSSNVYGHDWRFQTNDAGDAVENGALKMIRAHAKWRKEIKIEALVASMPNGDPILANHMRWEESERGLNLFLDLDGLDESMIDRFFEQFVWLCETGPLKFRLGDGVCASVVLDLHHRSPRELLSRRSDGKQPLIVAILQRIVTDIVMPNLLFMIIQAANPVNQASHPAQVVLSRFALMYFIQSG